MKENLREAILYYSIRYDGDWNKIGKAIQNKEFYQRMEYPYPFITMADEDYPACFRKLRYPPWILFYQGNIKLLDMECIGIVGSRNCSSQALYNTQKVVNEIKERYCVVSGLAKGIDGKAHRCALDCYTIGIIGCGINRIYPYENKDLFEIMKEKQLIISEYPMDVKPLAHHFPWRNRLIAACSKALIVIEAKLKSGTMLTVNECIELSVPVYCLPTAFENQTYLGCNYLIFNGAMLLLSEKELKDI
ncbi:MAG: DNA-protecting protein DprA [Holdemanella sp.]|nr:DNA-protecting protein DprA [Holdemanella sp.]